MQEHLMLQIDSKPLTGSDYTAHHVIFKSIEWMGVF